MYRETDFNWDRYNSIVRMALIWESIEVDMTNRFILSKCPRPYQFFAKVWLFSRLPYFHKILYNQLKDLWIKKSPNYLSRSGNKLLLLLKLEIEIGNKFIMRILWAESPGWHYKTIIVMPFLKMILTFFIHEIANLKEQNWIKHL